LGVGEGPISFSIDQGEQNPTKVSPRFRGDVGRECGVPKSGYDSPEQEKKRGAKGDFIAVPKGQERFFGAARPLTFHKKVKEKENRKAILHGNTEGESKAGEI